jgi:peptide subunit release factor 1 (eRF1)
MSSDIAAVAGLVKELASRVSPTGKVLSVYLATGPQQAEGQGYILSLRDGCRALRADLPPGDERKFEAAVAQAESYIAETLTPGGPGVAIFASGSPEYFHVAPLPSLPVDEVVWDSGPQLHQLQAVLDDYERVAVALFDKERTRLFSVFLGEIESQQSFEDEVPGKQATGDWFALAQARYARHHEEHVARHAKRTVTALMEMLRTRPFDRLFLAGPDEALTMLRGQLTQPLRTRLAGTIPLEMFATDQAVLDAARTAAEGVERAAELAAVQSLVNDATTPHVVLGVDDTLTALNEGRAHVLFIGGDQPAQGVECTTCGRLASMGQACLFCRGETAAVGLKEAAIRRARSQGARIEIVSGEAAQLLAKHGGLSARTRY